MSTVNLINGGLDVQSIVDNLITAERQPITNLQNQTKGYQDKITAYQEFNTRLLALKTSVEAVQFNGEDVRFYIPTAFSDRFSTSLFALRKATSSDEAVVTATADKGEAIGNYNISVTTLAKYNSFGSNSLASDTATSTKTGTLVIKKGSADAVTITIDSSNNTLQGIKNAINNADAGFTATVINDGNATTPYRLILTSDDSGSANGLSITNNLNQGTDSAISFTQITAADDAAFTVNGVNVTRGSNTITDVIDGITLNLKALTNGNPAQITLTRDTEAIVTGIKDFVSKYNDVVSYISSQAKYDSTTKTAGILSGDFTLRNTQSQLGSTLFQSIQSDGSTLSLLSQVGIKLGNDGTLSVDETKLKNGLSDKFQETAKLFLADGQNLEGDTVSIIPKLQSLLKSVTDNFGGAVHNATDALQQNILRINEQIAQMELRLETRRELLIAQYSKADEALRQLSVLQSSLSSQLSSLSSTS
jgi:flagellar hook-associated protein 2